MQEWQELRPEQSPPLVWNTRLLIDAFPRKGLSYSEVDSHEATTISENGVVLGGLDNPIFSRSNKIWAQAMSLGFFALAGIPKDPRFTNEEANEWEAAWAAHLLTDQATWQENFQRLRQAYPEMYIGRIVEITHLVTSSIQRIPEDACRLWYETQDLQFPEDPKEWLASDRKYASVFYKENSQDSSQSFRQSGQAE